MKIKLIGMYGMNGTDAWYSEDGSCFEFRWDEFLASNLTPERVDVILKHKNTYIKMFNASDMIVVD